MSRLLFVWGHLTPRLKRHVPIWRGICFSPEYFFWAGGQWIVLTTMLMEKQKTTKTWLKCPSYLKHAWTIVAKCASEQTWETKSRACVNDSSQLFGCTSEAPPWKEFLNLNTFHAGLCNCILYCVEILKSCHILQKDEIPWRCKPRAHISTILLTAAGSSFNKLFSSRAQMFQNKSCFPSKPSYPKKIVEDWKIF